jgi:AcrR family transcriptional regulator
MMSGATASHPSADDIVMSPSTSPAGGRLDIGAVRRQQVVMAVRKLVAREGVGAVTIARIAKLMRTSRGVVNYHFKNKEEILRAALQSAVRDASAATDQMVAEGDDTAEIVRLVVGLAATDSDWWQVYIAFLAESTHDPFAREMIRSADRNFRAHLSETLGNEARAAVTLALMKGLALQRVVDETFEMDNAVEAAGQLLTQWRDATA